MTSKQTKTLSLATLRRVVDSTEQGIAIQRDLARDLGISSASLAYQIAKARKKGLLPKATSRGRKRLIKGIV